MIGIVVALVVGVFLPVADVDGPDAAHEQFQLVFIENLEHRQRNQILETVEESPHLRLDARYESPLNDQTASGMGQFQRKKERRKKKKKNSLDVFVLVIVGDGNVGAVGFQFALERLAETLFVDGEVKI